MRPVKRALKDDVLGLIDQALFVFVVMLMLARVLMAVDTNWDTLNYHLPFAARRAGLLSFEDYRFTGWLEMCFQGFPPLPYYAYGLIWRLTGNPSAINLVSGSVYGVYCASVSRFCRAPLVVVGAAIAAIPVIHVNLGSAYTDLMVNLIFAGALFVATVIVVESPEAVVPHVLTLLALLALAANLKLQFVPIVGGFLVAVASAMIVLGRDSQSIRAHVVGGFRKSGAIAIIVALVLVCLCFASALRNLYLYGNPIFPISTSILGHQLAGAPLPAYSDPLYLRESPQFVRWLLSVVEYRAFDWRPTLYTVGQGSVPRDAHSLRMGGYLSIFVIVNLCMFVSLTITRGGRFRIVAWGFAALTGIVSCLPGSHELRYYSFWFVYLVTLNVALLWRWGGSRVQRRQYSYVAIAAFVFVCAATGLQYILPPPGSLDDLVAAMRLDRIYRPRLRAGTTYCLVGWKQYPLLGSPLFHPHRGFRVIEGDGGNCPMGAEVVQLDRLG